jgi:hypothetical protein
MAQESAGDAPRIRDPDPAGVLGVHRNLSHWYNNASFSLPLLGAAILVPLGFAIGSDEAKGFGTFLLVIAALMAPFIAWTWRVTPTAIIVTTDALVSMHGDRLLNRIEWPAVVEVERKETMGNVRWRVLTRDDDHIAIEGEIEDVPGLLREITRLSGKDEEVVAE